MPLFTRSEFADYCNVTTNALAVQIGRKKVVESDIDGKKLIDTDNATNVLFRTNTKITQAKKKAKGTKPPKKKRPVKKQQIEADLEDNDGEDDYIDTADFADDNTDPSDLDYAAAELALKQNDVKKRGYEAELFSIRVQKAKGSVLPIEIFTNLMLKHNQSMVNAFRNVCENLLLEYQQIKEFSPEEIAKMRGAMVESINTGIDAAAAMTERELDGIVDDFSAKKGQGEKV